MTIQIIRQPTIRMTQSELDRLRAEYNQTYSFYSGTPPAFEDWAREKQSNEKANKSKVLDAFDKLERDANRQAADLRAEIERAARDRF